MFRLVVFLAFVLYAFAELSFDGADQSIVLLAEYGSAETYVSVLYKGPLAQPVVTRRKGSQVFTTGDVQTTVVGDVTNFTIPFMIVNVVGVIRYNITVGNDVVMGNITAAGFILTNSTGHVVSGEEGNGAFINLSGNPTKLDVKAVNTDGKSVDISSTTINPRPEMGVYMKELNTKLTTINSEQLVLVGNFLRLGTGLFFVEFETPTITLNDESFVTLLKVKQRVRNVSCVAYAGKYQVKNGFVRIAMYNVGMPPRNFSLSDISITVGSTTVSWDTSKSLLDPPDQTIFFRITEEGSATITCDGEPAVIVPAEDGSASDTIEIEDNTPVKPTPSPPLATTIISELPEPDPDQLTFEAVIRVVKSDPDNLGAPDATLVLNTFCDFIGSSGCVISKIVQGSAVLTTEGYIDDGKADDADNALRDAFSTCDFQNKTGYACEDEIVLLSTSSSSNKLTGGSATASGLAPWAIALIASLGAFVLVCVIVLALWFVYRRSADQSESEYSSSGPLGVPDPSDLLYEQSIVRDIYGRGDFGDGGPSRAVAVERAKEAAKREEFLRPPSSSSVSRGHTDDASSTYSV